jgi:hypothetical protein
MKKLFAILLAFALMATMSVTAFAADNTFNYDENPQSNGTTVTYSVEPGYTVTIPTDVTIDGNSTTISAEDVVVEKGQYVSVTLAADNNFTVKTTEGAELTYTVTANGENIAAGGEILAVNPADSAAGTANITFDIDESAIKYAGTYTGSATFTIAVKDAPKTIPAPSLNESGASVKLLIISLTVVFIMSISTNVTAMLARQYLTASRNL